MSTANLEVEKLNPDGERRPEVLINQAFDAFDRVTAGYLEKNVAGATSPITLDEDEARYHTIKLTGARTQNLILQIPATGSARAITFINATTGSFTTTAKIEGSSGTTYVIARDGNPYRIEHDGTNIYQPTGLTAAGVSSFNSRTGAVTLLASDVTGVLTGATIPGPLSVSGQMNATNFVGNGAGLTGIGTGTGGVINTGSTTIGADSDANGDGIISLQTRGVERMAIVNDGKIGVGTNAPSALMDFNKVTAGTGVDLFRFRNNQSGVGDFGFKHQAVANTNTPNDPSHAGKYDNILTWGYNLGGAVAGEHHFGTTLESRYITAGGAAQLEYYVSFNSFRPFSITPDLDSEEIITRFACESVRFNDAGALNEWLHVNSTSTTGRMRLLNDAQISFDLGAGDGWAIKKDGGEGWVGKKDDNHFVLYGGNNNGASDEINFFSDGTWNGINLILSVGGAGGTESKPALRYAGGVNNRWQASNDGTSYFDIGAALPSDFQVLSYTRTLGTTIGNTTEIGSLTGDTNNTKYIEVVIISQGGNETQSYVINKNASDLSASWYQLLPSSATTSIFIRDIVLDYKPSTNTLRLRRYQDDIGGTSVTAIIKVYGGDVFTPSTTTGTGASVAGIYRNTTLSQFDGNVLQVLPQSAPSDELLLNSTMTAWLNEADDELVFKTKYSDGTVTEFVAGTSAGGGGGGALTWTAISSYSNGWQDNSWTFDSSYAKDANFVYLKGMVANGTSTAGTVMFNLPAGYRPSQWADLVTIGSGTFNWIRVATNGDVTLEVGSAGNINLTGLMFPLT